VQFLNEFLLIGGINVVITKEYSHSFDRKKIFTIMEREMEPYIKKYGVKLFRTDEYSYSAKVGFFGSGEVRVLEDKIVITIDSPFLNSSNKAKVESEMDKYVQKLFQQVLED